MVFTLVSAVQEELTTLVEQSKQRREEAELKRKHEEEELERVCKDCLIFITVNAVHFVL